MAILFWKYKKCNYICIKQKTNSNIYSKQNNNTIKSKFFSYSKMKCRNHFVKRDSCSTIPPTTSTQFLSTLLTQRNKGSVEKSWG